MLHSGSGKLKNMPSPLTHSDSNLDMRHILSHVWRMKTRKLIIIIIIIYIIIISYNYY